MIDINEGLLAGAMALSAPLPAQPLQLIATPTPSGIELKVIGASPIPLSAAYSLAVTAGAGNRSTQSGRVQLHPGRSVTLVSLALGGQRDARWTASLHVEPQGGESYDIKRSNP